MALLNAEMDTIDGTTPTHPRHQREDAKRDGDVDILEIILDHVPHTNTPSYGHLDSGPYEHKTYALFT